MINWYVECIKQENAPLDCCQIRASAKSSIVGGELSTIKHKPTIGYQVGHNLQLAPLARLCVNPFARLCIRARVCSFHYLPTVPSAHPLGRSPFFRPNTRAFVQSPGNSIILPCDCLVVRSLVISTMGPSERSSVRSLFASAFNRPPFVRLVRATLARRFICLAAQACVCPSARASSQPSDWQNCRPSLFHPAINQKTLLYA